MSLPSLSTVLYPLALVAGNAATGAVLYVAGALSLAVVLWLSAVLVVAGLFAVLGQSLARAGVPASR
jgi:hypothetical protein